MSFIKDLIAVNCLTQGLLIILYFNNKEFFDSLFAINQHSSPYFWFLIAGNAAFLWLTWTALTSIFGIRRLGHKAESATRKARE